MLPPPPSKRLVRNLKRLSCNRCRRRYRRQHYRTGTAYFPWASVVLARKGVSRIPQGVCMPMGYLRELLQETLPVRQFRDPVDPGGENKRVTTSIGEGHKSTENERAFDRGI